MCKGVTRWAYCMCMGWHMEYSVYAMVARCGIISLCMLRRMTIHKLITQLYERENATKRRAQLHQTIFRGHRRDRGTGLLTIEQSGTFTLGGYVVLTTKI